MRCGLRSIASQVLNGACISWRFRFGIEKGSCASRYLDSVFLKSLPVLHNDG
jgi:hypothetical protein